MKSLTKYLGALSTTALFAPMVALAQFSQGNTGELGNFGAQILTFIDDVLVPFLFAVALMLFIYGVYVFMIQGGGEDESREKGRRFMLWGVVAFVIVVSVWGITNLIAEGLGLQEQDIDDIIPNAINIDP